MEAVKIYSCVWPWWCSAHLVWLIFMWLRGTVNFLWGLTLKVRKRKRNRFMIQLTVSLVAVAITVPCSYGGSNPTWWLKCPSMQSFDPIIVVLRDYLDSPMPNDARRIWRANIKHMFAIVILLTHLRFGILDEVFKMHRDHFLFTHPSCYGRWVRTLDRSPSPTPFTHTLVDVHILPSWPFFYHFITFIVLDNFNRSSKHDLSLNSVPVSPGSRRCNVNFKKKTKSRDYFVKSSTDLR